MTRIAGLLALIFLLSLDTSSSTAAAAELSSQQVRILVNKECGACHLPYRAKLLPSAAWEKILANLSDHYGDVVSLSAETKATIEKFYLNGGSWDSWSIAPGQTLPRITTQTWWKRAMGELDFKKPRIRSKANCAACHTNADAYLAVRKDE